MHCFTTDHHIEHICVQGVTSPLAGQMLFRSIMFGAFGQAKTWLSTNSDGSTRALKNIDFYKVCAVMKLSDDCLSCCLLRAAVLAGSLQAACVLALQTRLAFPALLCLQPPNFTPHLPFKSCLPVLQIPMHLTMRRCGANLDKHACVVFRQVLSLVE